MSVVVKDFYVLAKLPAPHAVQFQGLPVFCPAEDRDAAVALCEEKLPGSEVLWVTETDDPDALFRSYEAGKRLTPGSPVVVSGSNAAFKVRSVAKGLVTLTNAEGDCVQVTPDELAGAGEAQSAAVFVSEVEGLLDEIRSRVLLHMRKLGNTTEDCQQTAIINQIYGLQQCLNGVEPEDMVSLN